MPDENDPVALANARIAGTLLSSWLPVGLGRQLVMFALAGLGLFGIITGRYYLLIAWPAALLFSPRIVGDLAYFVGRMSRR